MEGIPYAWFHIKYLHFETENFNKISKRLPKPERKFVADITYGMLASGSCLLTDVVDPLHEPSKKINVVDRLSRHLEYGSPVTATASYLREVKKWAQKIWSFISMTAMS